MPDAQTPNDINGKYQAMKFAEWKGAIGEKVENMDDRLVRVESKLDKLIPRVAGIGATIALIVTILVLLTKSAFGVLTDFSFADRDTVIADKETIFYDYHFKIYRTDTIASWPIQVDNYENFACYIEGSSLPHSDSFAMAAVYYQSGTYDSLFSRIDGYERSILDTAITDTIGQWHTFYPLLKYVKIYIYGDTIGTAANPVSSADSNTVRVRVRLSKWKGTQLRIPGTGVYTHHHDEFVGNIDIHGFVAVTDSVVTPRLIATDSVNITTLLRCPDVVASDSLTTDRLIAADSVNTARLAAGDSVNVGTLLRCPDITATDSLTSARVIASDSVNVTTLLRCPDVVATDSVTTARLVASDSINAARIIVTDSLNVPTVTIVDSLHVPWLDVGDSATIGTLVRCPDIIATDSLTTARVIVSDSVNVITLLRCPDIIVADSTSTNRLIATDSVNTARLVATDSVNVTTLLRCPDVTATDSLTSARLIADSLNAGTLVRTPLLVASDSINVTTLLRCPDVTATDSLTSARLIADSLNAGTLVRTPLLVASDSVNVTTLLRCPDITGTDSVTTTRVIADSLNVGTLVRTPLLATTFASIDTLLATVVSNDATAALTIQPGGYAFNVAGYLTTGLQFNSGGYVSFMGDNDEFFRLTLLGANKGDVTFFDNAATPVRHAFWDASLQHLRFNSDNGSYIKASVPSELEIGGTDKLKLLSAVVELATPLGAGVITTNSRLRPTSDHGVSLGSDAYAFDTVYAADFDVTSGMFSGTGDEALSILETVQALPGDRLDHEAIHPYLTPSSPNTVSLNRWIALLTVAVQELEKKNQLLEQRIEGLSR